MPFQQWFSDFFSKRGLLNPDERPLFAYKTSSAEVAELQRLLHKFPDGQHDMPSGYPQAWLLFAAEWWKRQYSGGAWKWRPLCESAGQRDVSHEKTRKLVIEGARQWRLQTPIRAEGKRFISVVAVNGGLPTRLVELAQGGLSGLLRMVTEHAIRYNLSDDQLSQAITSQAALLPVSYQQAPIYELLKNVVNVVLHIRSVYSLQDAQDPIEKLEKECPGWEDLFPIELDTQVAASLIKGLVKGTVGVTSTVGRSPFRLQRGLRFSSDGSMPVYELSFAMQASATRDDIAESLGVMPDLLPPHFQLLLRVGDKEQMVGEAVLRDDEYQLSARRLSSIRTLYDAAHLIISRWGATIHVAGLPGGEALSPDEPLIFEDTYPFARLLAQGDAVVKGDTALVVVAPTTVIRSEGEVRAIHEDLADGKKLVELQSGKATIVQGCEEFSVSISASAAQHPQGYWLGKSIEVQSGPGLLICGKPRLRIEQESGLFCYAPSHELFVRTQSQEIPISQMQEPGLCRLIWRKGGRRLLSTRAIILSEEASIVYEPGPTTHEGTIRFFHWPDIPVRCRDDNIEFTSRHDGKGLIFNLKNTDIQLIASVHLTLQWPEGEQQIRLPFPGSGVTILRENEPINCDQALTVDELMGCRALLMSEQDKENWQVRLTSLGIDGRSSLTQEINYPGVREIRLFELIPAIQKMLSCRAGLDHVVQLELVHVHQIRARLQIGRYSTYVRLNSQLQVASLNDGVRDLILDAPEAEGLLLALPLAKPESDPINLPLHLSEGVFTGSWPIQLPKDVVGPCLIYCGDDSPYQARPAVIPLDTDSLKTRLSPLRQALCESDSGQRKRLLSEVLQSMAENVQDKDWQTLELLLDRLHHLPLASLDIFQALIREPLALTMATLRLDSFSSRLAERLPSELPFEWMLIAPNDWFKAFSKIREQFTDNDNRLLPIIRDDIKSKSQYFACWQPALSFIFEQGFHCHFDIKSKDVALFMEHPSLLIDSWNASLFDGERSAMQQMFRRNTHQKWPTALIRELEPFLRTSQGRELLVRSKLPLTDYKLSVVMLPFMAAFDAYAGQGQRWQTDPERLFSLRNIRQFDMTWFDLAYSSGLAMAQADFLKK